MKCLPPEVVDRLPLTHHRALLPLPDDGSRARLARQALAEGWSSRTLTTKVRELRLRSRAGRKPRPKIAMGIEQVVKGLEVAYEQELSSEGLGGIGREEAVTLAGQVEQSLERLAEIKRVLDGVLGGSATAS